jgi:hypothetical protein
MLSEDYPGERNPFGRPVPVAEDTPALDRLLGLSGQDPAWCRRPDSGALWWGSLRGASAGGSAPVIESARAVLTEAGRAGQRSPEPAPVAGAPEGHQIAHREPGVPVPQPPLLSLITTQLDLG